MTDAFSIPRGISRHEHGRARGWLVRIYRTEGALGSRAQKCVRRLFSDGVHGGEAEALHAAMVWQSEQQGNMPPRERKRTAGYGYVQRGTRSYRTASGELRSFDAFVAWFWDAEGRVNSTSYGIEAHGAGVAEQRCREWLESERAALAWRPASTTTVQLAQAV